LGASQTSWYRITDYHNNMFYITSHEHSGLVQLTAAVYLKRHVPSLPTLNTLHTKEIILL